MKPMTSSGSWVVFYHLRYPFLNIVARKVKRLIVFQTLTMPGKLMNGGGSDPSLEEREILLDEKWPKMAFVVGRLAHDPTNWRVPSASCVEAMLRSRRCVRPTNHCR
jgi:tRNA (mo5U34)-methyltransferase